MLTGKTYDAVKWLAQIGLPALGALYFGLAQIWGLPAAEEVVGSIVVVDTFLGALLGISQQKFSTAQVGEIKVSQTGEGQQFSLELDHEPVEGIADKDKVVFDVVHQ